MKNHRAKKYTPQQRIKIGSVLEPVSGCWNWLGSTNKRGYAHLRYNTKMWRANRFSWTAFKGPIPDGQHVLHHCDNRLCVNPDHFFLGTDLDNARDRDAKRRHIGKTPRGVQHGRSKLTPENVYEIRQSLLTRKELAEMYGVTPAAIGFIHKRKNWKHLEERND